jgi:hypothetical protein
LTDPFTVNDQEVFVQMLISVAVGAIAIGIAAGVVKGAWILIEATQGHVGVWAAWGGAAFVAYLVGNAVTELRSER